jgi:hypothetical protein
MADEIVAFSLPIDTKHLSNTTADATRMLSHLIKLRLLTNPLHSVASDSSAALFVKPFEFQPQSDIYLLFYPVKSRKQLILCKFKGYLNVKTTHGDVNRAPFDRIFHAITQWVERP